MRIIVPSLVAIVLCVLGAWAWQRSRRVEPVRQQWAYHPSSAEADTLVRSLADRGKAQPGRVLIRVDGTAPADVLWESDAPDATAPEAGGEHSTWRLIDGDAAKLGERVIARHHYYARPDRVAEMTTHRLHASDVREKLGFARGRIWQRVSVSDTLPELVWELGVASEEERRVSETELVAHQEFQDVRGHMRTLLRAFQMSVFRLEPASDEPGPKR